MGLPKSEIARVEAIERLDEKELLRQLSITTVSRLQGKTLQISILTRSFSIDRFLLAKYHNHYHLHPRIAGYKLFCLVFHVHKQDMYVNHMFERSNKLCDKK